MLLSKHLNWQSPECRKILENNWTSRLDDACRSFEEAFNIGPGWLRSVNPGGAGLCVLMHVYESLIGRELAEHVGSLKFDAQCATILALLWERMPYFPFLFCHHVNECFLIVGVNTIRLIVLVLAHSLPSCGIFFSPSETVINTRVERKASWMS